jgi:hypothetical protein
VFAIAQTRGIKFAIDYNKKNRMKFLIYVFSGLENPIRTLPRILRPVAAECKVSGSDALRASLSVLYIPRCFRLEPKPSFASIEKAPCYKGNPSVLRADALAFLKSVGLNPNHLNTGKVPSRLRFKDFHFSSKGGPNGPALWSAVQDFLSLPDSLKQDLIVIGGDKIAHHFNIMSKVSVNSGIQSFFSVGESRLFRKLSLISDKEGKTREVAIADYWTQTCLRPLHDYQYSILRNMKADCTHDQTKLFKKLKADRGHAYHSIDLTTATDRFPIDIQKEIILLLAGSEYAESWKRVMIGYPFHSKLGDIYYRTGNPMGFYSSFSSFALAHHFFVWLACRRAGKSPKYRVPYMLLGDDIVIGNDDVAREYKNLLVEWDIPFNPSKTYTSIHGFEFAKQIRYKDINISPLSLSSFYNNRNDYTLCVSFLIEAIRSKGWNVDRDIWIETYLRKVQKMSSTQFSKVKTLVKLVGSIVDYLQGRDASLASALVQEVLSDFTSPELQNPAFAHVFGNEVLRQILIEKRDKQQENQRNVFLCQKENLRVFELNMLISLVPGVFVPCRSIPFVAYYDKHVMKPLVDLISNKTDVKPLTVDEKYNASLLRESYSVSLKPTNLSEYYARGHDVLIKTSWVIAKTFMKKVLEVKYIPVFNRKYPITLIPKWHLE